MQQNQLKTDAEKAAARTEVWMLHHISEENLFYREISDPIKYYKWQLGEKREALDYGFGRTMFLAD